MSWFLAIFVILCCDDIIIAEYYCSSITSMSQQVPSSRCGRVPGSPSFTSIFHIQSSPKKTLEPLNYLMGKTYYKRNNCSVIICCRRCFESTAIGRNWKHVLRMRYLHLRSLQQNRPAQSSILLPLTPFS